MDFRVGVCSWGSWFFGVVCVGMRGTLRCLFSASGGCEMGRWGQEEEEEEEEVVGVRIR